ncbi:LLM class flavin-dependent oxidoreductase [Actinomycetes bacterium KLBMP 9759]
MADYAHDMMFGTFLTPAAADPEQVVALAELTDRSGLDLVTVQDHPYQHAFLDTWTLLSVIAARTSTVHVSPNVANLPLRDPAILARAVASLDLLTGGRVELGLGAGAFWDGIVALGHDRLTAAESVEALAEGIDVIRALWGTGEHGVRAGGRHHHVRGARPGPAPAHDVGIWVGAYKPTMLALTGRLADGWLPSSAYAGPDTLPDMNARIDDAAFAAGRKPSDVRRLYNISGTFDRAGSRGSDFLQGNAASWAEQLADLALAQGMSGFILASDDPDTIRRFAAEVAPAVRELVDLERRGELPDLPPRPAAVAAPAAGGFPVRPTPDDGVRRSVERAWDESERPTGPAHDPDRTYHPAELAGSQHLVAVHDQLREELRQLRDLVEQVTTGDIDPTAARNHIAEMTIRQNTWTVGAYCASYCRIVTTHHTIEDMSLFPHLRRADPRLTAVVDRLQHEHGVIHEVLERVDRALVAFVDSADAPALRNAVDLLTDALFSHLAYEERELLEPLARLGAH